MSICLRESLYEMVSEGLSEIVWIANLPIHPSNGLHGFFSAFREQGVLVLHNPDRKEASFRIPFQGKLFETTMSYEDIQKGWSHSPKSSPRAYYDSICQVYDNAGKILTSPKKTEGWADFRNSVSREVREKMEENWKPYFFKHQEHMLLPFSMEVPDLGKPELFDKVIGVHPMNLHQRVLKYELESEGDFRWSAGPCPEYLLETDFESFDEDYHPSGSTMNQFLWANYLQALAEMKGFPLRSDVDKKQKLRDILALGERAFVNGSFWKMQKQSI